MAIYLFIHAALATDQPHPNFKIANHIPYSTKGSRDKTFAVFTVFLEPRMFSHELQNI